MKAIYLACLLGVCIVSESFAQSYFGLTAGLNRTKFSGDSPQGSEYSFGSNFQGGLIADFRINRESFISTGIGYQSSNVKLKFYDEVEEKMVDSIRISFQAIYIPVLLKILSNNEKYHFIGGAELMMPQTIKAKNDDSSREVKDQLNTVIVSMVFGVGRRIPVGKSLMTVDLTYLQGLTNLASNLDNQFTYLPRVKSISWRLSVAWLLPVGGKS